MVTVRKDTWKGIEEDKLASLSPEEFMKRMTSRSRRTLKRLKYNQRLKRFIEKVSKIKKSNPKKIIKTQIRDAVILPDWVGLTFSVHNGKEYKRVDIMPFMVGKRLGEFVHTTGRVIHSGPGVGATRGSKFVPLK